ncbi:MAG TPA: response regulator transcription factor [Thermoflexales bacterium]|jgi:DNA-binding NarL/FixJ family response regulator|nr:response regulator transcription factor [Thermoflexales bacterium]HQX10752.1 response regulator transcription factor [Thermoflexales bacterium]HQY23811.1 response regulator transcription factor [Thermoflexales bacterium]HQZ53094.1 response regulator transcription factor [Thermoflexales bacterium]HRA55067.1 response regulator transcription factor [Thermoflexales bacterium]
MSTRILIVDDQRLMREGLRTLLELEPDFAVTGEAGDGAAALEAYEASTPDIVLMDIRMPGMDGVEATRRLRARHPGARVIILTTFDDEAYVFEGLRAGAQGYLLKDLSGDELATAIRTVMAGGALIEPSVARKVFAEFARLAPAARPLDAGLAEPLTEREREVLRGVAEGLSNREIGQKLFLTEGTVKNYVTSVLQKIGARDRTQAALRAREMGVL